MSRVYCYGVEQRANQHVRFVSELLLAVLLDTFLFSPGEEEAEWNMGIICSPVLKTSGDDTPRLPLKVSVI